MNVRGVIDSPPPAAATPTLYVRFEDLIFLGLLAVMLIVCIGGRVTAGG
jgi:apolipoprotein N-acyltransferase